MIYCCIFMTVSPRAYWTTLVSAIKKLTSVINFRLLVVHPSWLLILYCRTATLEQSTWKCSVCLVIVTIFCWKLKFHFLELSPSWTLKFYLIRPL